MAIDDIACVDARQFVHAWMNRAVRDRVPLQGSVNLTDRCNLRCAHCYVGSSNPADDRRIHNAASSSRWDDPELTTAQWVSIFEQIADAGCLFLLVTGGEPLLRPDFAELYLRIVRLGILPAVFTNATPMSKELCDLFREYPPRYVEVSLYGATAETYERVTGVPGSFDRCMRGIRLLHESGCRLGLKTVMMTLNAHEVDAIRALAGELGVRFRMDGGIFPRLNGDCDTLRLRVDPVEAVGHELANKELLKSYREFYGRVKDSPPTGKLYQCGTGARTFHVDSSGFLLPCMVADEVRYDLKTGPFAKGWKNVIPAIREIPAPEGYACGSCGMRFLCGICPPLARRESGGAEAACEYWCSVGRERLRWIVDREEAKEESV